MKIRHFRVNKFGSLFVSLFTIFYFTLKKTQFQVQNEAQVQKYLFNEKPLLSGDQVQFYTMKELQPAFRRPAQEKFDPGEGGKPVHLSREGDV